MRLVPWRYLIRGTACGLHELSLGHFQQNFFQSGLPVVLKHPENIAHSLAPNYEALKPFSGSSEPSGLRLWKRNAALAKDEVACNSPQPFQQHWDLAFGGNRNTLSPFEVGVSPREEPGLKDFLSWLSAGLPVVPQEEGVASQMREQGVHLEKLLSTELLSRIPGSAVIRFDGSISLFELAVVYNEIALHSGGQPVSNFYVAQLPIADLPPELQKALSPPQVVLKAGKGDVYGASLWMGLTPTKTSWHRDPNPNILSQTTGSKIIRMLPPGLGERLFHDVHTRLGRLNFSSRIRGMELLDGPEASALDDAVWGPGADQMPEMVEAKLHEDESLFIPQGWWHSVKSFGQDTGTYGLLNVSVNYWFR